MGLEQKKMLGIYQLGPNSTKENGIYIGNSKQLAKKIPDESVDLIFTDPIYGDFLPSLKRGASGDRVRNAGVTETSRTACTP